MTSYYVSLSVPAGAQPYSAANSPTAGNLNMGTSSYASDGIELRITLASTNGPAAVTKRDIETAFDQFKRWLHDQGSGLDYVISATSGTVAIP